MIIFDGFPAPAVKPLGWRMYPKVIYRVVRVCDIHTKFHVQCNAVMRGGCIIQTWSKFKSLSAIKIFVNDAHALPFPNGSHRTIGSTKWRTFIISIIEINSNVNLQAYLPCSHPSCSSWFLFFRLTFRKVWIVFLTTRSKPQPTYPSRFSVTTTNCVLCSHSFLSSAANNNIYYLPCM